MELETYTDCDLEAWHYTKSVNALSVYLTYRTSSAVDHPAGILIRKEITLHGLPAHKVEALIEAIGTDELQRKICASEKEAA